MPQGTVQKGFETLDWQEVTSEGFRERNEHAELREILARPPAMIERAPRARLLSGTGWAAVALVAARINLAANLLRYDEIVLGFVDNFDQ